MQAREGRERAEGDVRERARVVPREEGLDAFEGGDGLGVGVQVARMRRRRDNVRMPGRAVAQAVLRGGVCGDDERPFLTAARRKGPHGERRLTLP